MNPITLNANGQQITIGANELMQAATKYDREFKAIPLLTIEETLKFFTGLGGLTAPTALPTYRSRAEWALYLKKHARTNGSYQINGGKHNGDDYDTSVKKGPGGDIFFENRVLNPEFIYNTDTFDPLTYVNSVIGKSLNCIGDGIKENDPCKIIITGHMAALGESLGDAIFKAKKREYSVVDTPAHADFDGIELNRGITMDSFDGFDTIVDQEIAAGKIAAENGNYTEAGAELTAANIEEFLKGLERTCNPVLRNTPKFIYCPPEIYDLYNDAYLLTHNAVQYNQQYERPYLEGSFQKTTFVPLACMAGGNYIYVTPKDNMYFGYDNLSNASRLQVDRIPPFEVMLSATMRFGVQIQSLDPRRFMVAKITA